MERVTDEQVKKALETIGLQKASATEEPETKPNDPPDNDEIVKAYDGIKTMVDDIKSQVDDLIKTSSDKESLTKAEVQEIMNGVVDAIGEKFVAMATIQKATVEGIDTLIEFNGGIETDKTPDLIKGLSDRLDEIKDLITDMSEQPNPQRSITKGFSDRNFSKAGGIDLKDNEKVLSASGNREEILQVMDDMVGGDINKGQGDQSVYDAAIQFEATGVIPNDIVSKIRREKGIVLVP